MGYNGKHSFKMPFTPFVGMFLVVLDVQILLFDNSGKGLVPGHQKMRSCEMSLEAMWQNNLIAIKIIFKVATKSGNL